MFMILPIHLEIFKLHKLWVLTFNLHMCVYTYNCTYYNAILTVKSIKGKSWSLPSLTRSIEVVAVAETGPCIGNE